MPLNEPIVNKRDIAALCQRDGVFAAILETHGEPPSWSRERGFVSLCQIILEQQVSLESARAHFKRLNEYVGVFSTANILKLSDVEMRDCHITRQKARYLRELSAAIDGGLDLEGLGALPDAEVRTKLTAVKGIGSWTANIYLMFCLQRKDIFPMGDIAVENTVKQLYLIEERQDIVDLSEGWKPLRSLAAYFFWHRYLSVKAKNRESA